MVKLKIVGWHYAVITRPSWYWLFVYDKPLLAIDFNMLMAI